MYERLTVELERLSTSLRYGPSTFEDVESRESQRPDPLQQRTDEVIIISSDDSEQEVEDSSDVIGVPLRQLELQSVEESVNESLGT